MFGLCTALWIEGSAMLLGGEGLCWEVLGLGLGLGGGVLAVLGPAGAWKGGWSGLSKPCSSNNCKFARKTSMLARRKKDKTGWMDEYMDGEVVVATAMQSPTISSMGGSHKVRRRSRDKNQYMREGAGDEQGLFIWDHVLLGGLKLRRTKLVRSAVG